MSSLLEELGYIEERGNIDSSLFNIEDLIFCNIPSYLDYSNTDKYYDKQKEFIKINGKIYDPSTAFDNSDEIIDEILSGDFFDFTIDGVDDILNGNPAQDTDKGVTVNPSTTHIPGIDVTEQGESKPKDYTSETDKNKNTTDHGPHDKDENEPPTKGFGKSAIVEWAADTTQWPHEPYELWVSPGQSINADTIIGRCLQQGEMKPIRSIFSRGVVRVDPSDGGFGRCAKTICHNHIIIDDYELAREKSWDGSDVSYLMKHPLMIHDYQVHQEEAMDAFYLVTDILPYLLYLDLIDGYAREKIRKLRIIGPFLKDIVGLSGNILKEIKSRLKKGKPSANNEIDLSDDEEGSEDEYADFSDYFDEDDLNGDVDIDGSEDDGSEDEYETSDESSDESSDDGSDESSDEGGSKKEKGPTIFNTLITDFFDPLFLKNNIREREPEDEFSEFINDVYLPRKKKFMEDVKALYGGDDYKETIKATKGNPTKIKEFGEEIIKLKNEYYNDIVEMCANPGFDEVDSLPKHEESSRIQWVHYLYLLSDKKMDFKFEEIIRGEGENRGEEYENGSLHQYDPIEEDETFSEYFLNVARMIKGEGDESSKYSRELRKMLKSFAGSHPTSGDARDNIKEELAKLRKFKAKIMKTYEKYKIEKIDIVEDRVLFEMFEKMPDEARWPNDTDYEYRGEFFRKWTFPNFDAMCPKEPYDDDLNPIDSMNYDYAPEGIDEVTMDDLPPYEDHDVDAAALYNAPRSPLPVSQTDPRTNEKPGNIEPGDLDYWRKYCAIATIITLPFLATGLYMVPGEYIQLPCIYIPLKVVNISKVGLIIVIGLAIRGVSINIMLIYLNMNKDPNTVLLPVTILLADIKDLYFDKIQSINKMVPMVGDKLLKQYKSNSVAMLKENKKYLAEMTGLDALQLPSKTELEKSAKEQFGEDTRQIVVRLEEDAKRYKDKWNNLEEAYTDFSKGFNDLIPNKTEETKEETT